MKTISIKQPYAWLICSGLKNIENRTWNTNYRGRVLVHASAKPVSMSNPNDVFTKQQWNTLSLETKVQLTCKGTSFKPLSQSAIIGSVEIVDCVINHPSIWAEKCEPPITEINPNPMKDWIIYNWVLANPVLFAKPILNVKGKLSFWEYPMTEEEYQATLIKCESCGHELPPSYFDKASKSCYIC